MAVTLAQAAVLSDDDLQRGVIESFVIESSVLDRLPFLPIEGNAYAYNTELTLPGVAFRNVNEAYTESTGTFVQASERLVILGGDADVDNFIVQTRGNVNDQLASQVKLKVKSLTYKFQDTFFNGDTSVDAKSFDGLKKRTTGGQVISMATNGAPVVGNGTTDTQTFFDKLEELLSLVPNADAIYANAVIARRILSAGRRVGGVDIMREDMTGKRLPMWNGIPILTPGTTPAGVDIIPRTETQGTSSVASSIYAVRFGNDEGDGAVTGLENGGVQVYPLGELQEKPAQRIRIEFYCGLALFGPLACARLTGVLNS